MRFQTLLIMGGLVALGIYAGQRARGQGSPAAYREGLQGASDRDYGQIRPAGKAATRDDRGRWDRVDEASDQSFPASDPPATY